MHKILGMGLGITMLATQVAIVEQLPKDIGTVVVCNTAAEQATLWNARKAGLEQFKKVWASQTGCVMLAEVKAKTLGLIASYEFSDHGVRFVARVVEVEFYNGYHSFAAWTHRVGREQRL